jgi:hypothetical protein
LKSWRDLLPKSDGDGDGDDNDDDDDDARHCIESKKKVMMFVDLL